MNTPWGYKTKFFAPVSTLRSTKPATGTSISINDKEYTNALHKLPYEKHILYELQMMKRDKEKMTPFLYIDKDIVLPWCKTDPYIEHLKYIEKLESCIMKQKGRIKLITDTILVHETDFSTLIS